MIGPRQFIQERPPEVVSTEGLRPNSFFLWSWVLMNDIGTLSSLYDAGRVECRAKKEFSL